MARLSKRTHVNAAFSLPASGFIEIESKTGFDITLLIDTANSPASGSIVVVVVYQSMQ
jgi:hypothetical protein